MRNTPAEAGETVALDEAVWKQALHEAMGGSGSFGSSEATGGLASVETGGERYNLILPKGVSGNQVEEAYAEVSERLSQSAGFRQQPAPVLTDKDWAAMSVSGRPPRAGGKPIDAKTFSSARLMPVGGDVYELEVLDRASGRYIPIGYDQGAPWFFRMSDFLKAGGASK
jgi:hypothetical protein